MIQAARFIYSGGSRLAGTFSITLLYSSCTMSTALGKKLFIWVEKIINDLVKGLFPYYNLL